MMIHNFVKYLVQTRLLEICYFYISQTKSSLNKIFYKIVYHHIIYMCDFFGEFRQHFCRDLHEFSRKLRFSLDMFPRVSDSLVVGGPGISYSKYPTELRKE